MSLPSQSKSCKLPCFRIKYTIEEDHIGFLWFSIHMYTWDNINTSWKHLAMYEVIAYTSMNSHQLHGKFLVVLVHRRVIH